MDLDLRLVRYFAEVAREGHFGRAAAALHITQPSLSRQIRALEQRAGARLFDRTPQGARLTAAGEVFLTHATALLTAAAVAVADTRAAASPARLTVGYLHGVIVTPAMAELRRQHPDAEVRTLHLAWNEPRPALLDRRVDAVVCRLPLVTEGLDVTVLYPEPRVLLIPASHRLAGKESVTLDDIADEPLPRMATDPAWNEFWRAGSTATGPLLTSLEDKAELIAAGEVVAIVPAGSASYRPDLTEIPLHGVEPTHVVLATRAGDRGLLLNDLRKAVRAHLTAPPHAPAT
ncbi:LysR family transcriptional regulator [Paractinoplanes rhizophilus]|uniref:LysR family transcriptional regulator n=1 Tax=Paractinoplanes rhizophilus TaxID=1416877 RepID=A0ABW2HVB2_9ACTN